jgi:hypothetical protein
VVVLQAYPSISGTQKGEEEEEGTSIIYEAPKAFSALENLAAFSRVISFR